MSIESNELNPVIIDLFDLECFSWCEIRVANEETDVFCRRICNPPEITNPFDSTGVSTVTLYGFNMQEPNNCIIKDGNTYVNVSWKKITKLHPSMNVPAIVLEDWCDSRIVRYPMISSLYGIGLGTIGGLAYGLPITTVEKAEVQPKSGINGIPVKEMVGGALGGALIMAMIGYVAAKCVNACTRRE